MTGQSKRPLKSLVKSPVKSPLKTFERKAGPMPTLKRAAPAAEPADADVDEGARAEASLPGFLSQREVLLRLVETLKSL